MRLLSVKPLSLIKGGLQLPGDKSIAHRAIILSAITRAETSIKNLPLNKDALSTLSAFKNLGIKIRRKDKCSFSVSGKGLFGLSKPSAAIYAGDSGTTIRLLAGVLAGQRFSSVLKAGKSLSKRPMRRVTLPLRMMGADISGKRKGREEYPPIAIRGRQLKAIQYKLPIASAQVKSALLLAGLYAQGSTRVEEKMRTRDHTERMLRLFKADIKVNGNNIVIKGGRELSSPKSIYIPSDISSASFFLVLASLLRGSALRVKNVSLNPSRSGVIKVLKRMGARIKVVNAKGPAVHAAESAGDILVRGSSLKAVTISREEVPSLIDELPILMLAACFAKGKSVFRGVQELRVKETDRIKSISLNLKKMGADIQVVRSGVYEDVIIRGRSSLKGALLKSFGDHRTAMTMVVAALVAEGPSRIDDVNCINKSFPEFLTLLRTLH